jgi:hypothetical protein
MSLTHDELIERIKYITMKILEETNEFVESNWFYDTDLKSKFRSLAESNCKKYLKNETDIIILEYLISKIFDEIYVFTMSKEYDKQYIRDFNKLCSDIIMKEIQ